MTFIVKMRINAVCWFFCACLACVPAAFSQTVNNLATENNLAPENNLIDKINEALWLTEHYPPYHYQQDNKMAGLGIEILNEIFDRNQININLDRKLLVYPWARAVLELSRNPKAVVLSMSWTHERAKLYKLSEPLFYESISLITLADSGISLQRPDDIAKYHIGTVRDDIAEKLVQDMTARKLKLSYVQTSEELIKLLLKKRIGVIAYSKDLIDYQIAQSGLSKSDFKVLRIMAEMPSTIAFHRDGDDTLFNFLNENIRELHEDGTIANMMQRFRQ